MKRWALSLVTALAFAATQAIPAAAATGSGPEHQARDSIRITTNKQFDAAHGIRKGIGTKADPYVISGWNVHHIEIKDTSKHVVIRNNHIEGQLVLDWIGGGVHVHDNYISDLRVNQNVRRTGDMTSGVISHNRFDIVGQLRHWDGVFEHNVVGSPSSCMNLPFFSCRGVNFDGFNGAKFRKNLVYGYVEVRLHGHHHSSGFSNGSHYHGTEHGDHVDHTKRHHQVWVSDNTIHSGDYYGLLYTDSNHAGNDRTATSEQNPELNKPHIHKTKVHLLGNKVYGAGINVDIFNADDSRHTGTRTGLMEIKGNEIHVQKKEMDADETFSSRDGIAIDRATDLKLSIVGNKIDGAFQEVDETTALRQQFDYGSGISLRDIDKARVYIYDNRVDTRQYGVYASSMTGSVEWFISGLSTKNVEKDVYFDSSVKNKPRMEE